MAQKTLTTSFLSRLSVANHDGVTQQICDRFTAFQTDNSMLVEAFAAVTAARTAEDIAYKRFSGKDFASDDLKKEDRLEDQYMSASRAILNGFLYLPDSEPLRRKAEMAVQVYKDFQFSTSDGFEAEARKTVNMYREWTTPDKYDLDALGIRPWIEKANLQAEKVLQLVTVRVDTESAKVKGELAEARKVTDSAIRRAYDILNALAVLQPSAELTALINVLLSIEDRAKLYYISSGSNSGSSSSNNGQTENGGTTPENGGGTNTEQGGGNGTLIDDPELDDNGGGQNGGGSNNNGGGNGVLIDDEDGD